MVSSRSKLIFFVAALALGSVLVFKNMVEETKFECAETHEVAIKKIYLNLQVYKFPATLWASHDGNVMIEYLGGTLQYISDLRNIGVAYQMFSQDKLIGQLSTLGNKLILNNQNGYFEGTCRPLK